MNKIIILALFLLQFNSVKNLPELENQVVNGSFENTYANDSMRFDWCYLEDFEDLIWYNRFSEKCNTTINCSSVPLNDAGYQNPQNGSSYAGFSVFDKRFEFRQYLVGSLKKKLINEKDYKFIFYLNASDCSGFYINSFGVYFTEYSELKKLAKGKYKSLQTITPTMEFNEYVTDTANWVKFEINFRANGTETNFIIGNFKSDKYISLKNSASKSRKGCDKTLQYGAYYLIDNVILSEK